MIILISLLVSHKLAHDLILDVVKVIKKWSHIAILHLESIRILLFLSDTELIPFSCSLQR
jgi:hypothetical protein